NNASPREVATDADNLPPPPAFLLQPDSDIHGHPGINVAETVKQLTELKHMPASPGLLRRTIQNQNTQQQPSFQSQNQNFQGQNQNFQGQNQNFQGQSQNFQGQSQNHEGQNDNQNQMLSTFQQAKSNFASTGNVNPIYGQTGHRIMAFENSMYLRKNSINSSNSDLFRDSVKMEDKRQSEGIYASPTTRHSARSHSADRHRPQ
ncbi:unnamed protein product, partial [Leptidea sinapis]